VSVIDMKTWKVIKRIDTLGRDSSCARTKARATPGRQHDEPEEGHPRHHRQAEARRGEDAYAGAREDRRHVEFTRDGRYALVSIWENDGALVIYDARSFREIKRLPMNKPSGKYNVYNKITRSAGTSH